MSQDMFNFLSNPECPPKTSTEKKGDDYFKGIIDDVYRKAKDDPTKITTEDVRRLSESIKVKDRRAASIITAVESYAAANEAMNQVEQVTEISLMTIVNDLKVAVDKNPDDITFELMKTAQVAVNQMAKVLNCPPNVDPELADILQEEIARIEPKIAQGTVTAEEAATLRSLETRVYGRTRKGSVASLANSVVSRRQAALSLSGGGFSSSNKSHARASNKTVTLPYFPQPMTYAGQGYWHRNEQFEHEQEVNQRLAEMIIEPKLKQDQPHQQHTHGYVEKGSLIDITHKRENPQPHFEAE